MIWERCSLPSPLLGLYLVVPVSADLVWESSRRGELLLQKYHWAMALSLRSKSDRQLDYPIYRAAFSARKAHADDTRDDECAAPVRTLA